MRLLELKRGIAITSYLTYVIYFNKREIICLKLKKQNKKKKKHYQLIMNILFFI